jgi:hypothetical protein
MNMINTILTTLQIIRKDNKGRRRGKGVTIKIVRLGVRNLAMIPYWNTGVTDGDAACCIIPQ